MDEYDQVIQALPSWLARPLLELLGNACAAGTGSAAAGGGVRR